MTDDNAKLSESSSSETEGVISPSQQLERKRGWLWLGAGLLAGFSSSFAGVYVFFQYQLAPMIEGELSKFLHRPVNLGELTSVSPNGLHFSKTDILSTQNDPAYLSLKGLRLNFDLLQFVQQRKLLLNFTAIEPRVYLEENQNGSWLSTPIGPLNNPYLGLGYIRWENADLTLSARSQTRNFLPQFYGSSPAGELKIERTGTQKLSFKLSFQPDTGGRLEVAGKVKTATKETNLLIRSRGVAIADIHKFTRLPFQVSHGEVDSNLEVKLHPNQPIQIRGAASVKAIDAKITRLAKPVSNISGQLRFHRTTAQLENIRGQLGSIPAIANGTVDWQKGYDISIKSAPVTAQQSLQSLNFKPLPLPVQGKLVGELDIGGQLNRPTWALTLETTQTASIDKVDFRRIKAELTLGEKIKLQNLQAYPLAGGKVSLKNGTFRNSRDSPGLEIQNMALSVQDFPLPSLVQSYNLSLPDRIGGLSGTTEISGKWSDNLERSRLSFDKTDLAIAGGQIQVNGGNLNSGKWQLNGSVNNLAVNQLFEDQSQIISDRLNGEFRLGGTTSKSHVSLQNSSIDLSLGRGKIALQDLQWHRGDWKTNLSVKNLDTGLFESKATAKVAGIVDGSFQVFGKTQQNNQWQATGNALLQLSAGDISAENIQVNNNNFSAILFSDHLLLTEVSPQWQGNLSGRVEIAGRLDQLNTGAIEAKGILKLSQVMTQIPDPITTQFHWQGQRLTLESAQSTNLQVNGWADFSPVSDLSFDLAEFALEVQAKSISLNHLPLPAVVRQFDYQGTVDFVGTVTGTSQLPQINGDLALKDFQWQGIALDPLLRGTVKHGSDKGIVLALAGQTSEEDKEGDRLAFSLDNRFQPLDFQVQWEAVKVTGERQEKQLLINSYNFPLALIPQLVTKRESQLESDWFNPNIHGQLSGNLIWDFPSATFSGNQVTVSQPQWGNIQGKSLSGSFTYQKGKFTLNNGNLKQGKSLYSVNASLETTPVGPLIDADIALNQSNIQDILEAFYLFEWQDLQRGIGTPEYASAKKLYETAPKNGDNTTESQTLKAPNPQDKHNPNSEKPTITLPQSSLGLGNKKIDFSPKDFLVSVLSKLPIASKIPASPDGPLLQVGNPSATLLEQLKQWQTVENELQKQQQQTTKEIPPLSDLKGTVAAAVQLTFSPDKGLQADFNLTGDTWQWGALNWEDIKFKGSYQPNKIALETFEIQSGDSSLKFAGILEDSTQSGELTLTNIPLDPLAELAAFPDLLEISGLLNGTVTLAGDRANPLARADLSVENARFNNTPLQRTQAKLLYKNARFFLSASSFLAGEARPFTLQGSLPYQFPFSSAQPDSDRFGFSLAAEDGGLALLNLLTQNQLNWIGGKGNVNLDVFGQIDLEQGITKSIEAEGVASVENGAISLRILPEDPLSQINGTINFSFDRLDVTQLTGNLNGGQLAVQGSLPLTQPLSQENPLTVNFRHRKFQLPEIYQGGVEAQLGITGTAFAPKIGGQVLLSQGVLQLNEGLTATDKTKKDETAESTDSSSQNQLTFVGLNLILGENIEVTLPPILRFAATGNLEINGSLSALQPQGAVQLQGGFVNFVTTLLRLSGSDNRVDFFPETGLDPYLTLRLAASAAETTPNRSPADPFSSEVQDPFSANTVDSLRTVRIQARIDGFASDLENSIELTSSPSRSQQEIVALLGGNVANTFNTLGGEESAVGLSNLAGSAVLGPIQGAIGNALGLSEFRVFTTPLIDDEERVGDTQIGVAAEASANLTDDLSFSILKILNSDRPPQLGLRYRFGDHWLIRGTSNFSDEGRGILEFEQRF